MDIISAQGIPCERTDFSIKASMFLNIMFVGLFGKLFYQNYIVKKSKPSVTEPKKID